MPAIQPDRLKLEVAELVDHFNDPKLFKNHIEKFLEHYADRTLRPGQSGSPAPLLPSYHVPNQVLRRIILDLATNAENEPKTALSLIDTLWEEPFLETRVLAARLLGKIPPKYSEHILVRVREWVQPSQEETLLNEIFDNGLSQLRLSNPGELFTLTQEWLETSTIGWQILGLRLLMSSINEPSFSNLPNIFSILGPWVTNHPQELRPYLLEIMTVLAYRSPQETGHFLRQNLILSKTPGITWLARKSLPHFPDNLQLNLRHTLRD
jgi:hypothetical protein